MTEGERVRFEVPTTDGKEHRTGTVTAVLGNAVRIEADGMYLRLIDNIKPINA